MPMAENLKISNSIRGIVTFTNGNAYYEIQLRNIIDCTVICWLD